MIALVSFMNFLDFLFFPFIVLLIISIIVEQIVRKLSNTRWHDDQVLVNRVMGIRKFMWNQALILNVLWFLCYFIFMFSVSRQTPDSMGDPNMLWKL